MTEDSARPPATGATPVCRTCADTGTMRWQQPVPLPGGGFELRETSHPCTCQAARDAGLWRHPAAEADRVITQDCSTAPARPSGQAAAANRTTAGLAALLAAAAPPRPEPGP